MSSTPGPVALCSRRSLHPETPRSACVTQTSPVVADATARVQSYDGPKAFKPLTESRTTVQLRCSDFARRRVCSTPCQFLTPPLRRDGAARYSEQGRPYARAGERRSGWNHGRQLSTVWRPRRDNIGQRHSCLYRFLLAQRSGFLVDRVIRPPDGTATGWM